MPPPPRTSSVIRFALTAIAVAACAAFIVRGRYGEPANAAAPATSPADLVGKAAPDFTLPDLDGMPVSLSTLKGHVVVLDLWATWCPPCVAELPINTAIAAKYADRGVKFYAISVDDEPEQIKAFLKQRKLSPPVLVGKDSGIDAKYGVQYIPQLVVIDGAGKVVASDSVAPDDVEKLLPVWIETALKAGQAR